MFLVTLLFMFPRSFKTNLIPLNSNMMVTTILIKSRTSWFKKPMASLASVLLVTSSNTLLVLWLLYITMLTT